MAAAEMIEVRATRVIGVAPGAAFDAWLDPVQAAKFLFASEQGTIIRAEIDAVVGGEFCIIDRREDEDIEHYGEYVEISWPERLVFDFSVNQSPVSRVAVDVVPDPGGSLVSVTNYLDAKWAKHAERARHGWAMILDRLARAVE